MDDKQRFLRRKHVRDNLEDYLQDMRYFRIHEEDALLPGEDLWKWKEEESHYVVHEVEEEL